MTAVSSRYSSPRFPTALVGVLGAIMCLTVPLDTGPWSSCRSEARRGTCGRPRSTRSIPHEQFGVS
ncbi:MAG TPA: hypothetical protein VMA73_27490 [Streptosporangiaceae bacterium]|nr:hypothetical protein [Streptosporangiaceae bacterium]